MGQDIPIFRNVLLALAKDRGGGGIQEEPVIYDGESINKTERERPTQARKTVLVGTFNPRAGYEQARTGNPPRTVRPVVNGRIGGKAI